MKEFIDKPQQCRTLQKSNKYSNVVHSRNILCVSSLPTKMSLHNSRIVCQMIGQDKIEPVIAEILGIKKSIKDYGGLCGGWSMMLLENTDKAIKMWRKFEELIKQNRFNKYTITKEMKRHFISVMKKQYTLAIKDMRTEPEEIESADVDNINILRKILFDLKVISQKREISLSGISQTSYSLYDIEYYEIEDTTHLSDIKTIVDEKKKLLIATDSHFMAIKKDTDKQDSYYVSETNDSGCIQTNWFGVTKSLSGELEKADYTVNLKYSNLSDVTSKDYNLDSSTLPIKKGCKLNKINRQKLLDEKNERLNWQA